MAGSGARPPRAIVFDFNGTLSNDEPLLSRIYVELMGSAGRPLTDSMYRRELAGNTDERIFGSWLGLAESSARVAELTRERIARYCELAADGSTIGHEVREAVRLAAEHVPVAVGSGAARAEIVPALAAAGLGAVVTTIVAAYDVVRGKPDPETYRLVVAELAAQSGAPLDPADVLAFEDTPAGIAAATRAGLHCIAIRGTVADNRLAAAETIVEGITPALIAQLLNV